MLFDTTLQLLPTDFRKLDRLSLSRASCLPIISFALRRQYPNQLIKAPQSSADHNWVVGGVKWYILDNGREVNRCRIELLKGAAEAKLFMIKTDSYENDHEADEAAKLRN